MGRLLQPRPEPRICYLQGESGLEGWGQGRAGLGPQMGCSCEGPGPGLSP